MQENREDAVLRGGGTHHVVRLHFQQERWDHGHSLLTGDRADCRALLQVYVKFLELRAAHKGAALTRQRNNKDTATSPHILRKCLRAKLNCQPLPSGYQGSILLH